jgi:hypothetical protein
LYLQTLTEQDKNKQRNACHWAAVAGNVSDLLTLINNKGRIDVEDKDGKTPLSYLCLNKRKEFNTSEYPDDQCTLDNSIIYEHVLYTWGAGTNFQLGHGSIDIKTTPKKVSGTCYTASLLTYKSIRRKPHCTRRWLQIYISNNHIQRRAVYMVRLSTMTILNHD